VGNLFVALQARDEELDGLFERIYEDNVSGKLSDDRFAKMSRRYEDEQKEISEKIKTLRAEMDKLSSKSVTADMFISTVRKYTRAKTLIPRMLNELIDHIEVHQAEKIDGIWEQHLVIHYNCVGAIFIPDVFPLPAPQVSVNTRKGVVVNYAPGQLAMVAGVGFERPRVRNSRRCAPQRGLPTPFLTPCSARFIRRRRRSLRKPTTSRRSLDQIHLDNKQKTRTVQWTMRVFTGCGGGIWDSPHKTCGFAGAPGI